LEILTTNLVKCK